MGTLTVRNPATLEVVGTVPAATRDDVDAAIARARAAQPAWEQLGLDGRVEVLKRFQAALLDDQAEMAALITRETGKPYAESLGSDVLAALESVRWVTTKGPKVLRPERIRLANPLFLGRASTLDRVPLGVIGVISPWNYPLSIPVGSVVYALLAGNTVVLKPASFTPLTALRMRELFTRAGLPEDALVVVPGTGSEAGDALISGDIDHLIFTGSVEVGRAVERRLAERAVKCCMELGGSDAAIVLADADVPLAARGIVWGRFTNAGQTCAAVKRCFVHRSIHDAFVAEVVRLVSSLRLGDPMNAHVDVGALTDPRSVAEMEALLDDARKRGARVVCGGRARPDLGGQHFEPTVVVDVPRDARLLAEECFGPILPIVAFDTDEEAVERANGTPFGLSGSVWTRDTKRGEALAQRLEAGTVIVNDALYTFAANETPWGGVKDSGHGRTHGRWGLEDVTRARHVNVVPAGRPSVWWFPYGPGLRDTYLQGARFLYGTGKDKARRGPGLLANLVRRLRR